MRVFLLFFVFCGAFSSFGQDLTGIWRGHFISANNSKLFDSLGIVDKYKFEIQIGQDSKSFEGVTYSYQTTVFYGKASCAGTINPQTKKVLLQETNLLEVKTSGGACLMTCFLLYSKMGENEFLEGKYTGINVSDSSFCGNGTVFLRKVPVSDFYKEPFLVELEKKKNNSLPPVATKPKPIPVNPKNPPGAKKPATAQKTEPVPTPANDESLKKDTVRATISKMTPRISVPKIISTRKNELVKTITTSAKEININIYDNGTIDNDTVSVYVNNKLAISKERLTDRAISLTLEFDDDNDEYELVMVAENLGEIPPNTSLMVINAGEQKYEVRITSTEQKNAVIRFKYEE